MKLLIDWSVLCHICWHKMASPDYTARTDIEQAEFARNLAGAVLYYIERLQPEETLFALDGSKYWRHAAFDKFYAVHTRVFKETVTTVDEKDPKKIYRNDIYYMQHDRKTFRLEWHEGAEKFMRTKLKKDEVIDLNVAIHKKLIVELQRENIPYNVLEIFPKYKGARRESKWDYTTSREDFKAMCVNIANNLSHTFKARVIREETAEADDIAYVYHTLHPKEDLVYVTTDSDWQQLLREGKFLKLYNPMTLDWVDTTPEQAGIKLAIKIISGDSSDGIAGLCPTEGTALIGPKNAEKLVLEHGVPDIYKHLETIMPEDYLKRNLRLIYLKNSPRKVKDRIIEALKKKSSLPKDVHTPEDYGLEKADIISIKAAAEEGRASDLEEGVYEE